jgi:hypothetical protein
VNLGAGCTALVLGEVNWTNGAGTGPSWVEFTNLTIDGNIWAGGGQTGNFFVHDRMGQIDIRDANVQITGSDLGPCQSPNQPGRTTNCFGPIELDGSTPGSSVVVLDSDTIHDFTIGGGDHGECVHLNNYASLTITNTAFNGCQIYAIYVEGASSDSALGATTIGPGNTFANTTNGWAIDIGGSTGKSNFAITGNTFAGSDYVAQSSGPTAGNVLISHNAFGVPPSCIAGATYVANTGASC